MDWKKVEDHGVPHDATGDDVIYVGVNSAGYCGCFNAVGTPDGGETWDAFYETAEDYTRILGDLKLWAVLDVPNAELRGASQLAGAASRSNAGLGEEG